jgi:hypothetical protein
MSDANSTAPAPAGKPNKPYPDFPLFAHATRGWDKKIRGKMHYFGPWDDPDGALKKYLKEKDALHAGRNPRRVSAGVTVKDLCNVFLNAKQALVDSGELTLRSWRDYKAAADLIVPNFGKGRLVADLGPEDLAIRSLAHGRLLFGTRTLQTSSSTGRRSSSRATGRPPESLNVVTGSMPSAW